MMPLMTDDVRSNEREQQQQGQGLEKKIKDMAAYSMARSLNLELRAAHQSVLVGYWIANRDSPITLVMMIKEV